MVSEDQRMAARRVPLPALLPEGTPVRTLQKGSRYMAICSFHEETTPSMSLRQFEDGTWAYHCFGCGAAGDPIRYIQKTQGMDFIDAVKLLANAARTAPEKPRKVAEYNYQDKDGNLLYQVIRYEPKAFRCRQMTPQGWVWCLDGVRHVLYRLPSIWQEKDATVYYVEGEKDVETLRSKGLVATTHRGGAGSFRPELLDCLPGPRRIVVVPDRDEPGMALMRKVFAAGRKAGHDVGFLLLPRHKDVSDWFQAGESLEDMLKEVR